MASSASFDSSGEPDARLGELDVDNRPLKSRKVAVIGAGAAGLAAAKELLREGHAVTVFEQNSRVGGLWVYDPDREEEDLLGANPARKRVHSSVYASLRTNLMREVMSYTDFPFLPTGLDGRDDRRFPGHAEVAAYLHDFALCFGLLDVIQLCTIVEHVGFCKRGGVESGGESGVESGGESGVESGGEMVWTVKTRRTDVSDGGVNEAEFDAVVVCNGHYAEPRLADSPDLSKWRGIHMHSHNYREQSSFSNQTVVMVGNGSSADDISRDIAEVAKEVHISGRTWDMWSSWNRSEIVDFSKPRGPYGNIWLHSTIECVGEDGTLKFKDGKSVSADIVMQCTGFSYSFPFLHTQGEVGVNDNCVGPLYEQVFPPSLAPSLAFIGLPYRVASIFRMFELQSRWVAMALSNKIDLPSPQEMMNSVEKFYAELQASGKAKRWAHCLTSTQENYDRWLSDQTKSVPGEPWRWEMAKTYIWSRVENPGIRKEEWVPNELLLKEAYRCLQKTQLEVRCS